MKELTKLDHMISKVESKRKAEALLEKRKQDMSNQRFKHLKNSEKTSLKQKTALLNKILSWSNKFSSSDRFKRIFKIESVELIIFYGSWGHVDEYEVSPGMWSRVVIDKKGRLEYQSGYKWMGFRACFYLSKENLGKIKYAYLKEFYDSISSGEVYETIKDEIKEAT